TRPGVHFGPSRAVVGAAVRRRRHAVASGGGGHRGGTGRPPRLPRGRRRRVRVPVRPFDGRGVTGASRRHRRVAFPAAGRGPGGRAVAGPDGRPFALATAAAPASRPGGEPPSRGESRWGLGAQGWRPGWGG